MSRSNLPLEGPATEPKAIATGPAQNGGSRAVNAKLLERVIDASAALTAVPHIITPPITTPPNKEPRTLEKLPAELKLQILSHLPIREIPKLRETSKTFRALIEEHENAIAQSSIIPALTGLDDFIKTHINYNAKTINGESAFMRALTDLINFRGLVKPSICFEWEGLLEQFLDNWRHRLELANGIEQEDITQDEHKQLEVEFHAALADNTFNLDPLQTTITRLIWLHFHYHVAGYSMSMDAVKNHQDVWLSIAPKDVGMDSRLQMAAVLQAIENGAWTAAKIYEKCPVTSCSFDGPASPFGIYAQPHWSFSDYDDLEEEESESDSESSGDEDEEVERKAHEERERAASAEPLLNSRLEAADDEGDWTVVGPSRKNRKPAAVTNIATRPEEPAVVPSIRPRTEPAPIADLDEYRESLPEAERQGYDDFLHRPIFVQDYGIAYDHKASETLDLKFQRMFGVPSLSVDMPFRYFVKSEWVFKLVRKSLNGKAEPSLFEKAAVLEELYAY